MPPRTLSVVPTPIGNLGDLTLRALETLRGCDRILAEDTRVTKKLCAHYGIGTPLESYHQFSEARKLERLLEQLRGGKHFALVSDGGTPGLSDPGARLIAAVRNDPDLLLEVLPGPSAILTALLVAGYVDVPFTFRGFLPRKQSALEAAFTALRDADTVTLFFEAPTRIRATLELAQQVLGPAREVAVVKELTKIHELALRGPIAEVLAELQPDQERGEFVLIVGPALGPSSGAPAASQASSSSTKTPDEIARILTAAGLRAKEARAILSALTGLSGSAAYDLLRAAQATSDSTDPDSEP